VWRLRLVLGTENSSGGDWTLYESREALESALFGAVVEVESYTTARDADPRRKRLFSTWRRANGGADKSGEYRVKRISGVDHLVDGEWVDVDWSITPPVLTLEPSKNDRPDPAARPTKNGR
jgi:hypothetical protein